MSYGVLSPDKLVFASNSLAFRNLASCGISVLGLPFLAVVFLLKFSYSKALFQTENKGLIIRLLFSCFLCVFEFSTRQHQLAPHQ